MLTSNPCILQKTGDSELASNDGSRRISSRIFLRSKIKFKKFDFCLEIVEEVEHVNLEPLHFAEKLKFRDINGLQIRNQRQILGLRGYYHGSV